MYRLEVVELEAFMSNIDEFGQHDRPIEKR